MLSLDLARKLAEAGLDWMPQERDAFVIPDVGMDQRIFIISDLQATVQPYFGIKHIIFHGSSEWALDNVLVEDAVWMPSETQLRMAIEDRAPDITYVLEKQADGYHCTLAGMSGMSGKGAAYPSAEDAYATALLTLLGKATNTNTA